MTAKTAKEIFLDAVEHVTSEKWPRHLDEVCGDDADLRHSVERLMAAHQDKVDLAEQGRVAWRKLWPASDPPAAEGPGARIGPYKLLQQIGEGGFGVVYMAEQLEPVRRKVALKIIKPGMDTKEVIARFE